MLRWLGLYAILLPLSMSAKQLLMARGEAMTTVRVRLAQALVFLPGVAAAAALESVIGVVAAVTAATAVGVGLANRYNAKVLDTGLRFALVAPSLACASTWAGFALLEQTGLASKFPWQIKPFLPPVVFCLVLLLAERRTLLREMAFLLGALRRPVGAGC
jgi:hypothetical protein